MSFRIPHRTCVIAVLLTILGALIVITPWQIFPVCEAKGITSHSLAQGMSGGQPASMSTGSFMKCGYAARAEVAVGTLVILTGFALFVRKARKDRKILGFVGIGPGVVTILIPTVLVGVCSIKDAPCRIGTRPALFLPGVLTAIIGVLLVLTRPETKERADS